MTRFAPVCAAVLGTIALGACAVAPPAGPNIAAMPPQGKSLEAFQQEDVACRQYAVGQAGISPGAAAQESQFNSAALGTVLGAGLGAAIGAAAGNPGIGAAIGAGSGAIIGTSEGARAASASAGNVQQRIDVAYAQCMASKGNSVPQPQITSAAPPYPYPPPAPGYAAYPYPYPYPYPYYGPYYYGPGYVHVGVGWHHWR
jgi:hypothetical protein